MKKIHLLTLMLVGLLSHGAIAQIDAGLFRYPDVSQTHIVFTYANDLWVVPKSGGVASRLSSPAGVEVYPKFSPDGKAIAFTGNYDGNYDIYTLPTLGGVPARLTYHGGTDRVVDWFPDGQHILFASGREAGRERFNQFFKLKPNGGLPEKLPMPYAEFGSVSPDGKQVALTFRSQIGRNWKRYRGGWNAEIHLFNLETLASENISATTDAADELPMWHGTSIYFLTDRGPDNRMNLWEYNTTTKAFQQLTHYADYDVHFPSLGPEDIVFEQAGKLFLFNLASRKAQEVKVSVVTDGLALKPTIQNVGQPQHAFISADAKRVLVEARGEVFSVPAEDGFVKNLTQSPGVAERYPSWSPDGKYIAYWSDRSGEYELTLRDTKSDATERKLTAYGAGFRYKLYWSPDSKKVAFIDKAMRIKIYDVATNQTVEADHGLRMMHYDLEDFAANWSADSRWLAFDHDLVNGHQGVFLFDYTNRKLTQVTGGYYTARKPVFDPEGKYLYLLTNQFFQPVYSDIDNTFVYPNSTKIAAISLKKSTPSPLAPKNDVVDVKADEAASDAKEKDKKKKGKEEKKEESKDDKVAKVEIDLDGLESRLVLLPMNPGNYGSLGAVKGKVVYHQMPNTGAEDQRKPLKYFDLEKREQKTFSDQVDWYQIAANGEKILIAKDDNLYIIKAEENQSADKALRLSEMQMFIDPREEWKQILVDAWRLERDYFYDPTMHGVNWAAVKDQYLKMLTGALTREEVNYVLGEMIGELNASHTYKGGGAEEDSKHYSVGYLGIDWQVDGSYYKVKKIIRGAAWDAEVRSPLDLPGVEIKEGNYILAVNGVKLTTALDPYAAFQGLAGKAVEITFNTTASFTGAKTAIVETLFDEARLRHLAWIEQNRKRVEDATGGAAGYIYVRSTGVDGQNELIRQFNAQMDKKSLVIDERFNNGGQIPDRFIELLNRPPLVFWAIRDGASWPWPPAGNFGPKVMLINGWSGSGGDAFPDYFRKAGLGPLIGARTWGGLIGISGVPGLIDGGGVTVPTFRMYNIDGTWFKEGHGVDPDIAVPEDLTQGAKGVDTQLERGITEIQSQLKTKGFTVPKVPAYEVR
ncbi:S41 family peptidase [Parachryseolinea silvisoli]|uniref:S41 family peptidase n=1 Tax=Parachryseolinea silvisoli TaxID=2873601 RepID=UPI002265C108|nr:S41 family peptidase [Parachryseolinea silvisoli]MCD9019590.1 PDZ domain-containing protein [Parachryseolinea silvisoli]